MNRRFYSLMGCLLLAGLVAAAPVRDVEALLREGNAAFGRGDFAAAVTLFEQAEERSTEPALVAFDLATALLRRADAAVERREVAAATALYGQAEELYRCCLEPSDPRRSRALFGLGICLAHKTEPPQAEDLLRAVAAYDRCLEAAGEDADLLAAARQQRELVRLRLRQLQPRQPNQDSANEENPANKPNRPDRQPQTTQPAEASPNGTDRGGQRTVAGQVKPDLGQEPKITKDPAPGGGNLPVIPDRADLPPLPPRDAANHLDQAARRILDDERAHKLRQARPAAPGVRDW